MENEYLITICATTSFVKKKTKYTLFLKAKRRGKKKGDPTYKSYLPEITSWQGGGGGAVYE
jgi:hypothetical protein